MADSEQTRGEQPPRPVVDQARFRTVLSHFASGVVVVTSTEPDGTPVGMTCQSFTSLSLDPPLVMVSPAKSSTTWPRIRATGRFAVNVLGAHQQETSRAFARSGTDKFAGQEWAAGVSGSPLLAGSIAHVECLLDVVHDAGDHEIAVGRVLALDAPSLDAPVTEAAVGDPVEPLVFFRSGYWTRD